MIPPAEWKHRKTSERPWRRVGIALVAIIALMFILGLRINPKSHPREFLGFWCIVLVLLFWLCALAIRDILYTRKRAAHWAAERMDALRNGDARGK